MFSAFMDSMNLPVKRIQQHKHGEYKRCTRLIVSAIEVSASLAGDEAPCTLICFIITSQVLPSADANRKKATCSQEFALVILV